LGQNNQVFFFETSQSGSANSVLTKLMDNSKSSTHAHTQPFNGHLSQTTRVSRSQKGKTSLDFTEASDSEWTMQVCTSLQTDIHASSPPFSFYRPDALPETQPTVSALKAKAVEHEK